MPSKGDKIAKERKLTYLEKRKFFFNSKFEAYEDRYYSRIDQEINRKKMLLV